MSVPYVVFDGDHRLASGSLEAVAVAAKHAIEGGTAGLVQVFDNATGRPIDFDTRGSDEEVVARLPKPRATEDVPGSGAPTGEPRARGRPKLGVVPREVTLLPRHWEWLATQPGGASVALRKLVEIARRSNEEKDRIRKTHERAYHFILAMAGDRPAFEEATRALFANDRTRFAELIAAWPDDVREHALLMAFGGDDGGLGHLESAALERP